jgi:hypothetical protein
MGTFLLGLGTTVGTFGAGALFMRQSARGRRLTRAAPFWGQLAVAPTGPKQARISRRRMRPEYVSELPLHSTAGATSAPNRPPLHAHGAPPSLILAIRVRDAGRFVLSVNSATTAKGNSRMQVTDATAAYLPHAYLLSV